MWLFLLAARHRMQALSALACSVGFGFGVFASLKIALFIQTSTTTTTTPGLSFDKPGVLLRATVGLLTVNEFVLQIDSTSSDRSQVAWH